MVPVQISLTGFLSYRETQVFNFENESLWMLSGPNGAGKTAVFDAMLYALYGQTSRGGGQNFAELIHRSCDAFSIEFDFLIGDREYRIKRTQNSKSQGTRQAFGRDGMDRQSAWKVIPETDQANKLDAWVQQRIGLDSKTFTASVLLQQGKWDVLIEADGAARHTILGQIVDLQAYQRLHELANDRRRECQIEVRRIDGDIERLGATDDGELARLTEQIDQLEKHAAQVAITLQKSESRRQALNVWKALAPRWKELSEEANTLEDQLRGAAELIQHKTSIAEGAARLDALRSVLPCLEQIQKSRKALAAIADQTETLKSAVPGLEKALAGAVEREKAASELTQRLQDQKEAWGAAERSARERERDLQPDINAIAALDTNTDEIERLQAEYCGYPSTLDEDVKNARDEREASRAAAAALPWLGQYINARQTWLDKSEDSVRVTDEEAGATARLQASSASLAAARELAEETENEARRARDLRTQAATRRDQANDHRTRFRKVEGGATCSYCGSELTAEHLEGEQKRLDRECEEAEGAFVAAEERLDGLE
ncbi:MAG: SMC family ATPase, partial [Chloroflexi bacterium]|nr:SMC family ATPase [Chloroflexota bacterium]